MCTVAVIWIDWYPYHVARFRALAGRPGIRAEGIELVGGAGVHAGWTFRGGNRGALSIATLFPEANWKDAGQLRLSLAVWRKLAGMRPSVVLVPGYYTAPALVAALWGRWNRRTTVLMTESTEQDHTRSAWKERVKSTLIRALFDWAVAGGEPHARYLMKLGFPEDRIARFYDVVDNSYFATAAQKLRSGARPASLPHDYFLYVGRLAEEKNTEALVQAFSRYRQRGGASDLVLVGDGPRRADLEALAAQLGLTGSIHFAGLQTADALPLYYAFARCFVLPSSREPWGLVVNEAMASGLPVVVSRECGCAHDLVREGSNGFLFDASDVPELAAALIRVGRMSASEIEAMGGGSAQIVSAYSPDHWAAEISRISSAQNE